MDSVLGTMDRCQLITKDLQAVKKSRAHDFPVANFKLKGNRAENRVVSTCLLIYADRQFVIKTAFLPSLFLIATCSLRNG